MRWKTGVRVYLPLVLLFWLFGSLGSLVLGAELHSMPQALNGVAAHLTQDIGNVLAAALGTDVQAAPSETGPKATPTSLPTPPTVHTTSATTTSPQNPSTSPSKPSVGPSRPAPPAPPKAGPGHGGPGGKGHKGHHGKGPKDNGNGNSDGNSQD